MNELIELLIIGSFAMNLVTVFCIVDISGGVDKIKKLLKKKNDTGSKAGGDIKTDC